MENYVLQLQTDDQTLPGQLLRKACTTTACASFADPELLGEPYMWLHMMATQPSVDRTFFEDDLGAPGRWSLAFSSGIDRLYGRVAPAEDRAVLLGMYESLAREFFVFKGLGSSNIPRFLRDVDPTIQKARALIDGWDAARLSSLVGRPQAEDFGRLAAISRMPFSRRAAGMAASALKTRAPTGTATSTAQGGPNIRLVKAAADGLGSPTGTPGSGAAPGALPGPSLVAASVAQPATKAKHTGGAKGGQNAKKAASPPGKKNRLNPRRREKSKAKAAELEVFRASLEGVSPSPKNPQPKDPQPPGAPGQGNQGAGNQGKRQKKGAASN